MKTILLALMTTVALTQTARAEMRIGGDQTRPVLKCQPLALRPDAGMNLIVTEGGLAGLTQVTVSRFFLGHSTSTNYIVKQERTGAIGSPLSYIGKGIRLTVNMTTSPLKDGGHYSTLQLSSANARYMTEELSCQTIYHTM